jgi:hypothetical protein
METVDICPSRDDAQRHVYENGYCVFCLTKAEVTLNEHSPYVKEMLQTLEKKLAAQTYIVHDQRFTPEMVAILEQYKDMSVVAITSIILHRIQDTKLKYFELRKLIFKQLQRIDSATKGML